jgi:hypothetical protein
MQKNLHQALLLKLNRLIIANHTIVNKRKAILQCETILRMPHRVLFKQVPVSHPNNPFVIKRDKY